MWIWPFVWAPASILVTPFPCGCLFSSLHPLLCTVFKEATVESLAHFPTAPVLRCHHHGPQSWVHYSDILFTTKSSSYLSFSFYLAPEPPAKVQWWTLKHHAGHSEAPAVHLCSSLVEKMKGLLLSFFKQFMIFKDLPEQWHLSWWWCYRAWMLV